MCVCLYVRNNLARWFILTLSRSKSKARITGGETLLRWSGRPRVAKSRNFRTCENHNGGENRTARHVILRSSWNEGLMSLSVPFPIAVRSSYWFVVQHFTSMQPVFVFVSIRFRSANLLKIEFSWNFHQPIGFCIRFLKWCYFIRLKW